MEPILPNAVSQEGDHAQYGILPREDDLLDSHYLPAPRAAARPSDRNMEVEKASRIRSGAAALSFGKIGTAGIPGYRHDLVRLFADTTRKVRYWV
jgi:hypothetical protein